MLTSLVGNLLESVNGSVFLEIGANIHSQGIIKRYPNFDVHCLFTPILMRADKVKYFEKDYRFTLEDYIKTVPPVDVTFFSCIGVGQNDLAYVYFSITDVIPSNGLIIFDSINFDERSKRSWKHIKTLAKGIYEVIELHGKNVTGAIMRKL